MFFFFLFFLFFVLLFFPFFLFFLFFFIFSFSCLFFSYFLLKSSNTPLLFLNFHFHFTITLQKKRETKDLGMETHAGKGVLIEEVSNHQETLALAGLGEVFKSRRAT